MSVGEKSEVKVEEQISVSGLVTLDKVRTRYDIRAAILRELAACPRGSLIVERELCKRTAGSDTDRFRRAVETNLAEFKPYRLKMRLDDGDPKWWWGHAEDIAEALRIYNL